MYFYHGTKFVILDVDQFGSCKNDPKYFCFFFLTLFIYLLTSIITFDEHFKAVLLAESWPTVGI